MKITDHSISLSVHQIKKVKTTKCVYSTFTAYDLEIQNHDESVMRITLFGADREEIVFKNGTDRDMR